ncbi:MAG: RluA family pseudouridine synthase [Chitinophagaceae bacterium]
MENTFEDNINELFQRHTLIAPANLDSIRIDKYIVENIKHISRNKVQQAIHLDWVYVNNRPIKPNYKVRPSDKILIFTNRTPEPQNVVPESIPLDIVYEDNDIMILYKHPGLVVHPGLGNANGTLLNGVAYYLQQQIGNLAQSLNRFGMVHRIDKNTSGILILAKNENALSNLGSQFFNHSIHREYIALVWGDVKNDSGVINSHIGRSLRNRKKFEAYPDGERGKHAITHYKVIERFGYTTLITCQLETGRTHQIRVHMKSIGHPIFSDDTYGGDKIVYGAPYSKYKQFIGNLFTLCPRQALHAKTLGIIHPHTNKKMFFEKPMPEDMQLLIGKWRQYVQNRHFEF